MLLRSAHPFTCRCSGLQSPSRACPAQETSREEGKEALGAKQEGKEAGGHGGPHMHCPLIARHLPRAPSDRQPLALIALGGPALPSLQPATTDRLKEIVVGLPRGHAHLGSIDTGGSAAEGQHRLV